MSKSMIWERARNIANVSFLRVNTNEELDHIYETKHLLDSFEDADQTEKIIKKEKFDLLIDRRDYIMAMDKIMKIASTNYEKNEKFWGGIHKILELENNQFKIDHANFVKSGTIKQAPLSH